MEGFKLNGISKIKDGRFLKNYELNYTNKAGRDKVYEIVSYKSEITEETLGSTVDGAIIVALKDDKLLLLREFRMGVNRFVFNLCAGKREDGETLEDCVRRELYEETGLELVKIRGSLKPAFAAVALSDIVNQLVFADVKGEFSDHSEDDELIIPRFYTKDEVKSLLENDFFTARAQFVAYSFTQGIFDNKENL